MPRFRDQVNREVEIAHSPQRIISTVPSQTELLYHLGLESRTVGITAYCVRPPHWLKEKTVIGGTKNLQLEKIRSLKPDLIIGNKEENIREQIEDLALEIPVWLSDICSVDDALAMIEAVGEITDTEAKAHDLRQNIAKARTVAQEMPEIRTLYFIWSEPFMVAGRDTFIGQMLNEAGLKNVAPWNEQRYPQLKPEELEKLDPDLILLSSEPYAFKTADLHNLARRLPKAKFKLVDGELFSWYGSRMLLAFRYFQRLREELKLLFANH